MPDAFVDLARQLFRKDVEPAFLERLSLARSNLPEYGDGAQIYDKCVRPAVIDLPKVAAHYAIVASVFEPSKELNRIYCYDVEREDYTVHEKGARSWLSAGCASRRQLRRSSRC